MQALGALNPVELAEGEIQKYVADFLATKSRLNRLRGSSLLNIRSQAEALYTQQTHLEQELNKTLAKIEQMKAGSWSLGDVLEISNFAFNLYTHSQDTKALEKKAEESGGMPDINNPGTEMMIVGVVGALILSWYLWKK